jgi:hypothetical protein
MLLSTRVTQSKFAEQTSYITEPSRPAMLPIRSLHVPLLNLYSPSHGPTAATSAHSHQLGLASSSNPTNRGKELINAASFLDDIYVTMDPSLPRLDLYPIAQVQPASLSRPDIYHLSQAQPTMVSKVPNPQVHSLGLPVSPTAQFPPLNPQAQFPPLPLPLPFQLATDMGFYKATLPPPTQPH